MDIRILLLLMILILISISISSFLFVLIFPKSEPSLLLIQVVSQVTRGYDYGPDTLDPNSVSLSRTSHGFVTYFYTYINDSNIFPLPISCNSSSMGGGFNCNDTILVKALNSNDTINIGDIIVYNATWRNNTNVIHAVERYDSNNNCWYMQGYNNILTDDWQCVNQSMMLYRAVGIIFTKTPVENVYSK